MSKGPGIVESRIAELFANTRDRALSIDMVTDHAFDLNGKTPTRVQRLSATRAAHRLLRRVREAYARHRQIVNQAHADTEAALGRERQTSDEEYDARFKSHPLWAEHERLYDFSNRIGMWARFMRGDRPGTIKVEHDYWQVVTHKRRLYFHPPDVPMQVWAVKIEPGGVHWFDAEVTKITERNVMVRYGGEIARLDRESLWKWWTFWRGVRFVSSRTGRIATKLDELWHKRYRTSGSVPPSLQMPLEQARALLGVSADYTREDVIAGFRRKAKEAHPDVGGTAEQFQILLEARDRLLSALGTSAPEPEPPTYTAPRTRIVYRRGRQSATRIISSATRRLT